MSEVERVLCADAPGHPESADLVCLLAFIRSIDMLPTRPLEREDHQIIAHQVGSLVALTSIVPASDYCGSDAETRLADVGWLASRARRHADVFTWAMQSSSIFPAPFGTLYASFDSLTTFMRAHESAIMAFLDMVADKEEWELRATVDLDSPMFLDRVACHAWPDWQALPKGTRYMRICRDKAALVALGHAKAAALADNVVDKIQHLTVDIRRRDAKRAREAEGPELIARYALLVGTRNVAELHERVRDINAETMNENLSVALSGPWPPFSFRPDLT